MLHNVNQSNYTRTCLKDAKIPKINRCQRSIDVRYYDVKNYDQLRYLKIVKILSVSFLCFHRVQWWNQRVSTRTTWILIGWTHFWRIRFSTTAWCRTRSSQPNPSPANTATLWPITMLRISTLSKTNQWTMVRNVIIIKITQPHPLPDLKKNH